MFSFSRSLILIGKARAFNRKLLIESDFGQIVPQPVVSLLMEFSSPCVLSFICDGFRRRRHAVFSKYVRPKFTDAIYCDGREMKPEENTFGKLLCGICTKRFHDAQARMREMNEKFFEMLDDPINGRF